MVVVWEITRACALACRHCRAEAIAKSDPLELNPRESELLIDQVARAKPEIFILTGGDPMYRRDLIHLIEYATRKGLNVAMSPSTTPRFLKADLAVFRSAGLRTVSLGLDGANLSSHDAFRGVNGAWDWTMQAYKSVRQAELTVRINTTLTRQNLHEFGAMARLVGKLQPASWTLFQVVPADSAKMHDTLTADQMERLFNQLYDLSQTASFTIETIEGQHYRRVALQRWCKEGGRKPGFNAINDGKGIVFVSHIGDIQPGGFLPITAGNVRINELLDIYASAPVFRELRDPALLKGKCGYCEFNNICGGSRARAYAMAGDYLAQEPLCNYQPRGTTGQHASAPQPQPIWRMYVDD